MRRRGTVLDGPITVARTWWRQLHRQGQPVRGGKVPPNPNKPLIWPG